MTLKYFIAVIVLQSVSVNWVFGNEEISKIYGENEFCDIRCFYTTETECENLECKCNVQNFNITDTQDLKLLSGPTVLCKDEDMVSLKWSNEGGIFFLNIRKGNFSRLTKATTCNLYTFGGLESDTEYEVRLFSIDKDGKLAGYSEFSKFRTASDETDPLPVSDFKVKDFSLDDSKLEATLVWSPAEDLSCLYDLVWYTEEYSDYFEKSIADPNELFETKINELYLGTNFSVMIRARRSGSGRESDKTTLNGQAPSCLEIYRSLDICLPNTPEDLEVQEQVVDLNPSGENPLYDIKVTWSKPQYVPDYYILIVMNIVPTTLHNGTSLQLNITGEQTEALIERLELSIYYQVYLEAHSAAGSSNMAMVKRHISGTRAAVVTLQSQDPVMKIALITSGFVILIVLILLVIMFYLRYKAKQRAEIEEKIEYTKELDEITPHTLDGSTYESEPENSCDEEWEVDQEKLLLKTILGEGAFGIVRRAWLDIGKGEKIEVAIKMLKESPSIDEVRQFYQEIEIMKSVGKHPHIVSLVGCITRGRSKAPLLVVEYCAKGDLQTYLRSIWNSLINRVEEMKQPPLATDTSTDPSSGNNFSNRVYELNTEEYSIQPKELVSFAHQVSMGMEYLSSLKVLHRDLAARNVLVCDDRMVKVSDFGLSRDVYQDNVYCKTGAGKLPLKWMALESLTHQRYTTQSDVWSFGILLWEIVTLGGNPYAGIAPNELLGLLQSGYRMEKPRNCSDELYTIMMNCWKASPKERPTFTNLRISLDNLLSSMIDYLNLDILTEDDHSQNGNFQGSNAEKYMTPILTSAAECSF